MSINISGPAANSSESVEQESLKPCPSAPSNAETESASVLTKARRLISTKILGPLSMILAAVQTDCKGNKMPDPEPAPRPIPTAPAPSVAQKGSITLSEIAIQGSPASDEDLLQNPPKSCQDRTTDTYARILAGSAPDAYKFPAYFLNPFDCFKEVTGPIVPPADALFDNGKKVKQEWVDGIRTSIHRQNPDIPFNLEERHQLPLFFRQTPHSSVETVLDNTSQNVKYNKKSVTLFKAIESELTKIFKNTGLAGHLRQADLNETLADRANAEKELRDCDKDIAKLKRIKTRNAAENEKLEELNNKRTSLADRIAAAAAQIKNPDTYINEFLELLLYGLLPQETSYEPAADSGQALGVWQVTPDACQGVRKKYRGVKCDSKSQHDIKQSTIVAAHYFDIIFSEIKKELLAFQNDFDIEDPTIILIPAVINSYNSGTPLINEMLKWFRETRKDATLELLKNGKLEYDDLYIKMSTEFYRACKQDPKDKDHAGMAYGSDSLQYYQKIRGWRDIIYDRANGTSPEENGNGSSANGASGNAAPPAFVKPDNSSAPSASNAPAARPDDAAKPANEPPARGPNSAPGKSCGLSVFIPEEQLHTSTHLPIPNSPVGNIIITGGYMEGEGHGAKKHVMPAIFADGHLETFPWGDTRNLGIDYKESRARIITWYGGTVVSSGIEAGYGNRTVIRTNVTYTHNGRVYPVYQGYGHARSFRPEIKPGTTIKQGQEIGIMGGTGTIRQRRTRQLRINPAAYKPHIDCRTYIMINGAPVDLSLNALETQLKAGRR